MFLDDALKEKINQYLLLTNQDVETENTEHVLRILHAFNFDPIKAASRFNDASMKMSAVSEAYIEEKLAHIKRPISEHFWSHFKTYDEAKAYQDQLMDEATHEGSKVFKKEFYDYIDKKLAHYDEEFIGSS